MELKTVPIEKPADTNFILGQPHFIKTIEDLHEAIVQTVPQMKFAIAFCESSGRRWCAGPATTRGFWTWRKRTRSCSAAVTAPRKQMLRKFGYKR
jgi:adenosine/AMP kinase